MKIAVMNIPALGHISPTLKLVEALIGRGDTVRYYGYDAFKDRIEAAGAEYISLDPYDPKTEMTEDQIGKIGQDLAYSIELIVDMTLAFDAVLLEDLKAFQPDLILSDSMASWGKLLAKKLNIPYLCSTTTFAFNEMSSKGMNETQPGLFTILKSMRRVGKAVKKLQKKGYAVKSVLDVIANDRDTNDLVYTSRYFQPEVQSFSPRVSFIGPLLREKQEEYIKPDRPFIYIARGSVAAENSTFYRNCLAALAKMDCTALISIGKTDPKELGEVPANVTLTEFADQTAVLEKADVFLTHCGMNSVSEALANAVPLVLDPTAPEQIRVAQRCQELGAGIRLTENSPGAIRSCLETVLYQESFRKAAAKIKESFDEAGGTEAALHQIDQIVHNVEIAG